jgi:hypothetical protein
MEQLPNEIHRKILCLLMPSEMINMSETCKTINNLNFSRYMIPHGLEGLYYIRDTPSIKERKSFQHIMYYSYLNIYELYEIPPFVSYCKEMSCEIDKILGCQNGNRYFRPSFCNVHNQSIHLSRRYITAATLYPNLSLIRRIKISNNDFLYGYLF